MKRWTRPVRHQSAGCPGRPRGRSGERRVPRQQKQEGGRAQPQQELPKLHPEQPQRQLLENLLQQTKALMQLALLRVVDPPPTVVAAE